MAFVFLRRASLSAASASNRLLRSFPVASRYLGRGMASERDDFLKPPPEVKQAEKPHFVVTAKDLESDESLWALYERWCKAWEQKREPDEMRRRFKEFKDTVFRVERNNKASTGHPAYPIQAVNMFADGKLSERYLMEEKCWGMGVADFEDDVEGRLEGGSEDDNTFANFKITIRGDPSGRPL